jgi:hypothetical protein
MMRGTHKVVIHSTTGAGDPRQVGKRPDLKDGVFIGPYVAWVSALYNEMGTPLIKIRTTPWHNIVSL